MKLLNGNKIAEKIFTGLKTEISSLKTGGSRPRLVVVLVGDNPSSVSYVEVKRKKSLGLGVDFDLRVFPKTISQDDLCEKVRELNHSEGTSGIIIQLPLPSGLAKQKVLDCVAPELDVDGLTSASQAGLKSGRAVFVPPTPAAILEILSTYRIALSKRKVVIVGSGALVGKPLAEILVHRGVDVAVASQSTADLKALTATADVLISGVGKPKLITAEMVKPGATVIDAGTTFVKKDSRKVLCGDVDFEAVSRIAGALTPVPGGVGPVTVAMLYKNLVESAKRSRSN
jgi:methylenetetrahydrofolate dehydrogenase (NADP+)/methenyltetrahydrofolate cyclohydrolase